MHHPTDRIAHTTAFVTPVVEHWLEQEIAQWLPGQISWYTVKFILNKCNERCGWCIYATAVTCADTVTITLSIQTVFTA